MLLCIYEKDKNANITPKEVLIISLERGPTLSLLVSTTSQYFHILALYIIKTFMRIQKDKNICWVKYYSKRE